MKSLGPVLSAALVLGIPSLALAESPQPPTVVVVVPDLPPEPPPSRVDVNIGVGMRAMLLPSAGFDPYASTDLLASASLTFGLTVLRVGNASITISAEGNIGSRHGSARGEDTSLTAIRLAGVAETRYQLGRRFFLALKVAPAAYHLRGEITDVSMDRPLVARSWTWAMDVTGGAGLLLGSVGRRGAKFWLTLDLGYTFAGEAEMAFAPAADPEDPRKYGAVNLPSIRPSGPVSRLGLSVAF